MAHRNRVAFQTHSTGDLLRRPAMHDPVNDRLPDIREARQLLQFGTSLTRQVMRCDAIIAGQIGQLAIGERIASDLAENRRAMPTELLGYEPDAET
jgi:hypothetical protein